MSDLERVTYLQTLSERCIKLCEQTSIHISQFPTQRLDLRKEEAELQQEWLTCYTMMNEEIARVDRFALSDLVFVTLCYLRVANNIECRTEDKGVTTLSILQVCRYIACQHTKQSAGFIPSSALVDKLKLAAAHIVVYKLSKPIADAGTQAVFQQVSNTSYKLTNPSGYASTKSDIDKISWLPSQVVTGVKEIHKFAEPPKNADGAYVRPLEHGVWFNEASRPEACFVAQVSRTLHALEFDQYTLSLFPVLPSTGNVPEYGRIEDMLALKDQFEAWLVKSCRVDTSDDFSSDFRAAVYELVLPVDSRLNAQSRKPSSSGSATVFPLTLLQFELGFDVASALSEGFGTSVRSIGFDKDHPFYQFMCLYMFGYVCYHEQRVEFIKEFFFKECDVYAKLKYVQSHTRFQRLREPLILRLQRCFYVHFWVDKTQGYFIKCADPIEACLLWLYLLNKFNNGELIAGHDFKAWSKRFLEVSDSAAAIEDEES